MPNAPPMACPCGSRRQAGQPCPRCGRGKRTPPAQGGWQSSPLYRTARWQARRLAQIEAEPLCSACLREGRAVAAVVADHVTPWDGDEEAFWNGPLDSLCLHHHGVKSARERKAVRSNS